jgi:predicted phosphodiesterase
MKVALISDVHGNAPALQAVLADAEAQGVEAVWFLGDVLGYGPLPVSCIRRLDRWRPPVWLMGNHDLAGIRIWETGQEQPSGIGRLVPTPGDEWRIILWHVAQLRVGLTTERWQQLAAAPTWTMAAEGVYVAHGAIRSPDPRAAQNVSGDGNSYIQPGSPALDETLDNLEALSGQGDRPWLLVVGHTHRVGLCRVGWEKPRQPTWREGPQLPVNTHEPIALDSAEGEMIVLSPGSAGYPRSARSDPRAAYAVVDLEDRRAWFRRVAYDAREAWAAMVHPPRDLHDAAARWAEAVQAEHAVNESEMHREDAS